MDEYSPLESSCVRSGFRAIAGVDEAGRGPLAGPVVAAAVIFSSKIHLEGVNDSKQLTAQGRTKMAQLIRDNALAYAIGVANHTEIDSINILEASILAMHRAIENLIVPPDFLLIDGNRFHHPLLPFETVVKGDSRCFSIAAASILAKVARDEMMNTLHQQYPVYGFDQHKGYPTGAHIEAIKNYGFCPVHRKSFTVKKLLQTEAFEDA